MTDILGKAFRRCGNCVFRELADTKDLKSGICTEHRIGVPIPIGPGAINVQPGWVPVQANDRSCGRWQMKPVEPGKLNS